MASVMSTSPPTSQHNALFDSVTQLVPPGHEKALRQAFYTAAAILFVVVGVGAAVSVYLVLQIFIKPLLWALLVGSFLFPFKYSLNSVLRKWMKAHEESRRPLLLGSMLLPFLVFDSFAEKLGNYFLQRWKLILAVAIAFAVFYLLYVVKLLFVLNLLLLAVWELVLILWHSVSFALEVCATYRIIIITLVGAYFIAALTVEPSSFPLLEYCAIPGWILIMACLISLAGSLQVPFAIIIVLLMVTGAATGKRKGRDVAASILRRTNSIRYLLTPPVKDQSSKAEVDAAPDKASQVGADVAPDNSGDDDSQEDIADGKPVVDDGKPSASDCIHKTKKHVSKSTTSMFFNWLFFAFAVTLVWIHVWPIVVLIVPLIYWMIKQLLCGDGVVAFLEGQCRAIFGLDHTELRNKTANFLTAKRNVLLPAPVNGMLNLIIKGDKKCGHAVLLSLPTVTTILVILILLVGSASMTLFFAVKVQQESFLMVQMTSDLINETVSKHPEYQTWLPDNVTIQNSMNSIVDKAYSQGREWIKHQVRSNLGKDMNTAQIEKQALNIWDQAYHYWVSDPTVSERKLVRRPTSDNLSDLPGLFTSLIDLIDMSEVIKLVQDNMSALRSVLESVWSVLQTNVTVVFSSLTTLFTVLLNGGTAILNFILSTVIFFTALFYLLAGSEHQYMPVQWIGFGGSSSSTPGPIGSAIQDAISGVFGASLKMAGFYGLFTWLNHTVFGAVLVYIPSLLAAVFSVVPVLTTYWVCFPAALEIWLLQGDTIRAVALVVCQFLPTMFVDSEIYGEMAESGAGHPYVTGLAVAGGLYYYGLEGAIIGPILLCILLVAVNVYSHIINMPSASSTTQEVKITSIPVHSAKQEETLHEEMTFAPSNET